MGFQVYGSHGGGLHSLSTVKFEVKSYSYRIIIYYVEEQTLYIADFLSWQLFVIEEGYSSLTYIILLLFSLVSLVNVLMQLLYFFDTAFLLLPDVHYNRLSVEKKLR